MKPTQLTTSLACFFLGLALGVSVASAADPPDPPKVSSYAPAADLIEQANLYIADFEAALSTQEQFQDPVNQSRLKRDGNTLAALALALALHDEQHPWKESAASMAAAARDLAAASDYQKAKAALGRIQTAAKGQSAGPGVEKTWNQQVAAMGQLMKQVNFVNARLRRGLRRLDRQADETARYAAVLGVIAQAVQADTHEVKDPSQVGQWYELTADMRDAAGQINAAAHAKDQQAAEAALKTMTQACDRCHAVFRVEGVQ